MQPVPWKKNVAVFMTSQAISLFGSSLVQYAITWYITLTTQSGVYMTLSIICSFVPTLFLSPFAGVWADRYDRKKLIMLSDGAIALATLILAIIFLSGYKAIWLLLAASAVRALGGAVQSPSVGAMIPDLVPEEQLTRVNGINGSIQSLLSIVSPALAGVLLTSVGSIELIFFIDVVTAALAILVMLRYLYVPAREWAERVAAGYFTEMKEGLSYIRRNPFLLHLFAICTILYISIAPVSFLTPLQVVRSYGEEYWRMTVIEIAFAAGMLGGGLLISALGGFRNRILTICAALVCMGAFTVLLGAGVPFWLYLALMASAGISLPFFNTPAVVLLQEKVDGAYIGRVFSILSMISGTMMPLGMLFFGPLADSVAIETLLICSGIAILVIAGILFMDRTAREAGLPSVKGASE